MSTTRQKVQRAAIGGAVFVATIYLTAFGTALLEERGALDSPSAQVAALVSILATIVSSPWFQVLSGLILGFALGVHVDAMLARRASRRWWENVQGFSIRDAACLLANVKRSDFERSDRAVAIANELRGYINSGEVPLFLEFQFEKPLPDFSDPKANYEPPYGKKDVGFDAVISRRTVEGIARGRKWSLPWPIPPRDQNDPQRPWPRPKPVVQNALAALTGQNYLGRLGDAGKGNDDK